MAPSKDSTCGNISLKLLFTRRILSPRSQKKVAVTAFLKLKKLRKEIKAEHRFHQKKYDFTNVSRAPLEGWGRTTLRESAKKANKYFKYRELLKESLSDAESIVQIIKGLDSLFEWEENEK